MLDYMHKILFPYCAKKQSDLALPPDYSALVLFDNFNGQCTEEILTLLLDNNNINAIIIPANCTDKLQPLDLTVNKPVKDFFVENSGIGMQNKFAVNWMRTVLSSLISV